RRRHTRSLRDWSSDVCSSDLQQKQHLHLLPTLLAAKRDLKLPKVLKQLARYHALVVDDLGYVQQGREEMEVLFLLLAERYERGKIGRASCRGGVEGTVVGVAR